MALTAYVKQQSIFQDKRAEDCLPPGRRSVFGRRRLDVTRVDIGLS